MTTCLLTLPVIIFLSRPAIVESRTSKAGHDFPCIESELERASNHTTFSTSPIDSRAAFGKLEL